MNRKTVSLLLVIVMCFTVLNACSLKPAHAPAAPAQPRVIIDLAGNEVELPEKIERVLITSIWPLPAVYCYFKDSTEGLIGIPGVAKDVAKGSVFSKLYPDILNLESAFITGTTINIEEVVKMKPDIVFYTGERQEEYALLKNAGIPAVGFTTAMKANGDVAANIADWLRQMEKIFGTNPRVEKLLSYNEQVYRELSAKLSAVAEKDKPKALIIFTHNENALQVAGAKHYSDYWLSSTGAINAAQIEGIKNVDIEQVLAWDPDIIYITNFTPTLPEDLLNNKIPGYDWSKVKAVKNKQVYKFPLGTYRSYAPSVESTVVLKWMSAINHPKLFADVDIRADVAKFYKDTYGYSVTQQDLDAMLSPSAMVTQTH